MQRIVILDFGGQYTQLIARRVRECRVYSEVVPWSKSADEIRTRQPSGIILSGGPASVTDPDAPHCNPAVYDLGVPLLGILVSPQSGVRRVDPPVINPVQYGAEQSHRVILWNAHVAFQ